MQAGSGAGKGISAMSWMLPIAVNFGVVLTSYFIVKMVVSPNERLFDDMLPLVTIIQSVVIWGMFGVYWLNDWYWNFSNS